MEELKFSELSWDIIWFICLKVGKGISPYWYLSEYILLKYVDENRYRGILESNNECGIYHNTGTKTIQIEYSEKF